MPQVHAFFDFDDTLLDGDSILLWLRFYYNHRPARRIFQLLNWAGLILFGLRVVDGHTLKRIYLFPMGLERQPELDRLAEEFTRTVLAGRLHVPVLQRLWTHHLLGHKIVILSASATFYLRHLKAFFPMADIQGSELVWGQPPYRSLPKYRDGNLRGENKIKRLRTLGYGDKAPLSFAYSDHEHDRFLLAFSEFPFCVRPTNKLCQLATTQGWPIFDWPRNRPHWKARLEKLRLLLFAAGPIEQPHCDPIHEAATTREYAPAHCRQLSERVSSKYPLTTHPEIHRAIFGVSSP